MLSNPPTNRPAARNRIHHRRQNSTPTGYETIKMAPTLANIQPSPLRPHQEQQQQQQNGRVLHRRGMSLDTRRQVLVQRRQEHNTVSTTNSTGSAIIPQHLVREAQQQCIARPGPQQAYANLAADENYLVSPSATPQLPCFDQNWADGLPAHNGMFMSTDMYTNFSSPFDVFEPSGTPTSATMMAFPESAVGTPGWISEDESVSNSRRNSRRVSNGIMERVSKYETLGGDLLQHPLTPPTQNEIAACFQPPSMDTPQAAPFKHVQPTPRRFADGYDESNEDTVKPIRHRANRRSQTVFDEMRQATEALTIVPEMRRANTLPTTETMDLTSTPGLDYFAMSHSQPEGLHIDTTSDDFRGSSYPVSVASEYSNRMSPITPRMPDLDAFDFGKAQLDAQASSSAVAFSDDIAPPFSPRASGSQSSHHHHRRTESIASLASAASIASMDIEGTKTMTGITLEDIQQYIQGPDPKDNKWVCVFEDCNKRFGRKENIKSHVQTHLNDRQFQCPSCHKCFVRQHDLKRHAKIHTGIKPYPCLCGNSFARHDALTRHRQRGMCIGAFEGSAPKNAKRGRPRKPRPDDEERRDKASRTRRKNKSSVSSVSSQGTHSPSSSDISAATSPEDLNFNTHNNNNDDFDLLEDIMDVSLGGTTMNPSSLQSSTAPMPALVDHHLPHQHHHFNAPSPSATSVQSYASQLSHATPLHSHSRAPSTAATDTVLPRSPTLSIAGIAPEDSGATALLMTRSDTCSSSVPSLATMVSSENESGPTTDLLIGDGVPESQLLLFGDGAKFDDSYDGVEMFTTNDDLIFGSS